jgi:hypothetical protein
MPVLNDTADALSTPAQDPSQAASPTPQAAPAPAAQPAQPAQPAVPAHVLNDSVLGKAVRALSSAIHGRQTQYTVNPQTGETEETTAPAKPGTVFRNLLLGALVGGAVGSEGHGGFVQGFARGGAAGAAQAQAQDAQRRQQGQQQFENQLKARHEQSEQSDAEQRRQYYSALIAHQNILTVGLQQQAYRQDQETLEKHNLAAREYEKTLTDAGGVRAKLTVDGRPKDVVNATDFMAAYVKDPRAIGQAPDGFQRHFILTNDLSEISYNGEHWIREDGSPANMDNHAQIEAIDMPVNNMRTHHLSQGSRLNKLAGEKLFDDDKMYDTSPEADAGLYSMRLKNEGEAARAAHQRELANRTQENAKKFGQIEAKKNESLAKAEHKYFTTLQNPEKDKDNALATLNFEKQQAQDQYESEIRGAGGTPQHLEYGNGQAAPSGNVDRALGLVSKLPKDEQAKQINSSTKLTVAEKKQALQRIGSE